MTDEDLPPTFDHEHIALGVVSAGDMTTRRRKVHLDTMTPTSSRRTDDSALDLDHDECLDFIKLAFDFARPSFVDDVHELCGGNLRHARGYWHGILASESMYENLQAKGKEHFGIYDHWDSLITGHHRVHHRRRSRLRNVFYAVPDSRRPRDLLIGYHLLQILHEEKGDQPSYISIDKKMEQYGYRQDEIFEALNYYVGYLIKLGSNEMPRPFRIRKGVVKAYLLTPA